MSIIIRAPEGQELPAIQTLFLESRRATFTWMEPQQFALSDFETATAGEPLLAAFDGATPVGFVSWWPPDDFVHNLFVAPGQLHRGIGSRLLAACLERVARPARLKCSTKNTAALEFYRRWGWVIEVEAIGPDGPYYGLRLDT